MYLHFIIYVNDNITFIHATKFHTTDPILLVSILLTKLSYVCLVAFKKNQTIFIDHQSLIIKSVRESLIIFGHFTSKKNI